MSRRLLRTPLVWTFVIVLGAGTAFGMYWFQPWKLVTDTQVNETLPTIPTPVSTPDSAAASRTGPNAPVTGTTPPSASASARPGSESGSSAAGPLLLAAGTFITHEHRTTGSGEIVRLPDGRHQLVLRDLATSNGPDLRVWLTDRAVLPGTAGWRIFDDGKWVELAKLKGNRGNQVYDIPASVNPTEFRSVSIWCRRFAVSFGAAELRPA